MKETYKTGASADCNSKKKQFRQKKKGIMKSKRKRSYKPSTKKKGLPIQNKLSTSKPSLEYQSKDSTRSNTRLAEFRIEEHHEERVGTNIL